MYHIIAVWCCVFQEVRISCSCSGYVSSWWYLTSPLDGGGYTQCTFQLTGPQKSIFDSADRWSACVYIHVFPVYSQSERQSLRNIPQNSVKDSDDCELVFVRRSNHEAHLCPFCGLLCKHSLVVKLSSLISVDVTRNGVSLDKSWQNSETTSCG